MILPNHWVGINPKRKLPIITQGKKQAKDLKYPTISCSTCSHRAVDDKTTITDENTTYAEQVYCSKHGWEFETVEQEELCICLDYNR